MSKYVYLIFSFVVFSCNSFIQKEQHEFIYEFEKENEITNGIFNTTLSVLKKRLNSFGGSCEVKRHHQKKIKILIKANELDEKRFDRIISNQGKLEFWELYTGESFMNFILELNNSLVLEKEQAVDSLKVNPILDLIVSQGYKGGPVIFQFKEQDTATLSSFLNSKTAKSYLSTEFSNVKFLWGIPDSNHHIPLYGAKSNRENRAPLTGESITNANYSFGQINNRPEVSIEMDEKGALIWERMTGKAFQNRTSIAITINNQVYSAPSVSVGPIKGGKSTISGNFELEEAQDLAIILSSQKSIPKLKLLQHNILK